MKLHELEHHGGKQLNYSEVKREFEKLIDGTRDGSNAYWFITYTFKKIDDSTEISWRYPDSDKLFKTSKREPICNIRGQEINRAVSYISITDGSEVLEKSFIVTPKINSAWSEKNLINQKVIENRFTLQKLNKFYQSDNTSDIEMLDDLHIQLKQITSNTRDSNLKAKLFVIIDIFNDLISDLKKSATENKINEIDKQIAKLEAKKIQILNSEQIKTGDILLHNKTECLPSDIKRQKTLKHDIFRYSF